MGKLKQALPEGYSVLGKEGINQILIWEPRWHDKVVLIADRRLMAENEILVTEKDINGQFYFPSSFYITGKKAREYPLEKLKAKTGYTIDVRAVPIDALEREVIEL